MERLAAGEDDGIDRCRLCHGVFLDFFDGDPSELARLLAKDIQEGDEVPSASSSLGLNCPDCNIAFVASPYCGEGPLVPRCPTCVGVFLSKEQLWALAQYKETAAEEKDWLAKVVESVQRFFTASS